MNKKGFTLIELLAVIVILAIIAVIAIPRILDVVEEAKKGSVEASALGYIDAVEKQIMINDVKNANEIADGIYSIATLTKKGVTIKGKLPSEGWVEIKRHKVVDYSLKIDNYYINPSNGNLNKPIASKNGTIAPAAPSITINMNSTSIYKRETVTLDVTKNKIESALTYESSNSNIVSVTNEGVITGVDVGQATITVRAGDVSDTVTIDVTYPPYAYSSSPINNAANGGVRTPTDHKSFFRYTLTNGELNGSAIESCVHSESIGGEVCIHISDTTNTIAKIKNYFGYDESTWTSVGGSTWTSPDGTKSCYLDSNSGHYRCWNDEVQAYFINMEQGIVRMTDKKDNYYCSLNYYVVGPVCKVEN